MNQDINTVIADFVNAAVERKFKELAEAKQQEQGSTPMGKILQLKLETDALGRDVSALQRQMDQIQAREIYRPDHVMARLSYIEGAINNMHNTASINQMIEDQISESQQKVEDMLEEKFEELDVEYKLKEVLEETINDGTISITFTR
jgi:TolA-binding protein